jgi:hypothetical protein
MPPRFTYWTLIVDGKPTAFRAKERDELLPTYKQIQRTQPSVVLRWFSKGKLWHSPEEERAAAVRERLAARERQQVARPREWRPGGSHRDPRAAGFKPKSAPSAWAKRRAAEAERRDRRKRRS